MALGGCTEELRDPALEGPIDFDPNRPSISDPDEATPYSGSNAVVLEAQASFRTGLDVHRKIITRTCSPNGGVCHNRKEYPDLHTPANFIDALEAPCNVQPGEYQAVFDRCERPGDRFGLVSDWLDAKEVEIGWLEYVPGEHIDYQGEGIVPDAESAGLHLYLADPLNVDRDEAWVTGQFIRTFVDDKGLVQDLPFFSIGTRWWFLDGGKHVVGEIREYQYDQVSELLSVGVVQGDYNRNGVFGARDGDPVPMIAPGDPETSYLIARLRGVMEGEEVPGSRMPLANQPLSVPEMLALFCLIEGLDAGSGEDRLAWPIDYEGCSYSANPEGLNLLGEGVTWATRISQVLEFNCGGCHSGSAPAEGLDLKDGDVYSRLLQPSVQMPELPLITPGEPASSYLWLKLTGDPAIMGQPMPYNPLTGEGTLQQAELSDIETWIINGAQENQ